MLLDVVTPNFDDATPWGTAMTNPPQTCLPHNAPSISSLKIWSVEARVMETSGEGKGTTAPGERGWRRDLNICCARVAQAVRGTVPVPHKRSGAPKCFKSKSYIYCFKTLRSKCLMHNIKHERLKCCVGCCFALLHVALFRVAVRCFASVM